MIDLWKRMHPKNIIRGIYSMKRITLILLCLTMVFVLAACGSNNASNNSSNTSTNTSKDTSKNTGNDTAATEPENQEDVELDIWLFTGTGMEPFIEEYANDRDWLTVNIIQQQSDDLHASLTTALAAGSGAPDISLMEISVLDKFKTEPKNFHNLADYGANDALNDFLDWKRPQVSSPDGQFIIGLPTDIGPMAMMFRRDIFEAAGLPTDHDGVSALIQTWDDYIEVGKTILDKTGKPMIYEATAIYSVVRGQAKQQYFNEKDELIVNDHSEMKDAFDLSARIAEEGLTAKIAAWSPEWGAGMNNGDFATVMGPAWLMGFMKGNAPDAEGLWNIAQMPGGSGNWGGSFMTVPAESKHPKVAYELIEWVLSPENQLRLFQSNNNFPSTPGIYNDPGVLEFTDPYFGDAQVGKIFAEAAEGVVPIYLGPDFQIFDQPIQQALSNVERNGEDPEKAWEDAIAQAERDLRR